MPYIDKERRKLLKHTPHLFPSDFHVGDLAYLLFKLARDADDVSKVIEEGMDLIMSYISQHEFRFATFAAIVGAIESARIMLVVEGYVSTIPNALDQLRSCFQKQILIPYELKKKEEAGAIE